LIIEKKFATNDTVSIKLSSGEEIVGRFVSMSDSEVIISKPMSLLATQNGMGLSPFMFTVSMDNKFPFNRNLISVMIPTESNMASQYIEQTSGLKF